MIEFSLENTTGEAKPADFAVSVIGIGGAGTNVIDRIALEGMPGADIICMNCDVRALTTSMAARKVQLGRNLTQGLGCGGDPELGGEAAASSEQEIRDLIAGRSMVFLCVGLGGGTGSGAAPEVARMAREAGAFVVVFATLPFAFEGRRRNRQALAALNDLRVHANALVTFENDRMGELVVPKKGVQEAFEVADKIIGQSVRAVTSLVTQPGLIHIGMDDLITALRNTDSRCLFGFGQAKGENRSTEALAQALKSPLLDRGQMLSSARNVLVHVCGGSTLTLFEIETLMADLSKHVSEDAQILFGAATDAKLNEHLTVTILTSLNKAPAAALFETPAEAQPAAPAPRAEPAARSAPAAETQRPVKVEARRAAARPQAAPQEELFSPAPEPPAPARRTATVQQVQPAGRAKPKAPAPAPAPVVEEEPAEEEPEFFDRQEVETVFRPASQEPAYQNGHGHGNGNGHTHASEEECEEVEEPAQPEVRAAAPVHAPRQHVESRVIPEPAEEEYEEEEQPVHTHTARAHEVTAEHVYQQEEEEQQAPAPAEYRQPHPAPQRPAAVRQAPQYAEPEPEEEYEEQESPQAAAPAPPRAPQHAAPTPHSYVPPQPRHGAQQQPPQPKKFVLSEIVKRPSGAGGEDDMEFEEVPAPPVARRALPPQRDPARREPDPERLTPIRPIALQPQARTTPVPPPFQAARAQQPPAPAPAAPPRGTQENFDERLSPQNRGRFERVDPTLEEGEDLDVPTFLRKKR